MSSEFTLEEVDVDGAIREQANNATEGLDDGDTRRGALKKAGLAGGALISGGALMSPDRIECMANPSGCQA